MRRREGSGEKEFSGATAVSWERMVSRAAGWKRCRSFSSVIRRVLEGGDGWESGGRLDKSRERDGRDEKRLIVIEGEEGRVGGE